MKWDKPTGRSQTTSDGRYLVMHVNEAQWVAYDFSRSADIKDLGTRETDLKARALCEANEAQLTAAHRRSA